MDLKSATEEITAEQVRRRIFRFENPNDATRLRRKMNGNYGLVHRPLLSETCLTR